MAKISRPLCTATVFLSVALCVGSTAQETVDKLPNIGNSLVQQRFISVIRLLRSLTPSDRFVDVTESMTFGYFEYCRMSDALKASARTAVVSEPRTLDAKEKIRQAYISACNMRHFVARIEGGDRYLAVYNGPGELKDPVRIISDVSKAELRIMVLSEKLAADDFIKAAAAVASRENRQ